MASLTSVLVMLLFVLAFDVGLIRSVGRPATVKKVLADSGVYDTLVPNALNQVKQINTSAGNIPLTDSVIKSAAVSTFTPSQIEQYANQIIDSTYAWLDGKTATPQFQIDLSGAKNTFADNVAKAMQDKYASLPVCTSYSAASFDAYSASCLPPGVTAAQAADTLKSQVLGGQGFLDQPVVNADTIKSSGSNQTVFNNQQIPKNYQRAKKAPLIATVLALLVAAGIVLLSASKRRGLRRVGIALAVVGIFMLLLAWGLNKVFTQNVLPSIKLDSSVVQQQAKTVATDLEQAVDKNYWMFGIIYAVIGASLVGGSEFLLLSDRDKKPKHEPKTPDNEAAAS